FGEQTILPEAAVVPIDPTFPFELAALIGCGVVTGVGSVVNSARVEAGATVAVIGCGGVGLAAIQGARMSGAAQIIAVDRAASKFALARHCGATDPARGFPRMVEWQQRGLLDLERLVTRHITLDEIDDAFADMVAGEGARAVVVFE